MSMPARSSGVKPRRTSEIDDLVVAMEIGTKIPYPSSHTDNASGTCSTPAALTDSQNSPSLVDASPILPRLIEKPRGEVVAHLPAARRRLGLDVGVAVELREELAHVGHAGRPHERLVAVVARAPVARTEGLRHRDVGHFLAVAEDAERGIPAQHLCASDDAGAPAAVGQAVVGDDSFSG